MLHTRLAVFTVAVLGTLSACSRDAARTPDVLAQDSTLTRDLQLANRDTAAQPQLKDVPTTSATAPAPTPPAPTPPVRHTRTTVTPPATMRPRRPTPVPYTPAPPSVLPPAQPAPATTQSGNTVTTHGTATGSTEGAIGTIPAGSEISLMSGQRVCTNTNTVGDRFTATVVNAVQGSNGVMIPAGATAVLEVTSLKRSNSSNDNMEMGFVVKSIAYNGKSYPVSGEVTYAQVDKVRDQNGNDGTKVAAGAVVGAILGRIFGHSTKSTVIGAAGGAAAGAVTAAATAKYDGCVPSGGRITVRLSSAMDVQGAGAS